jgi:polar amino acid transport system substrate-binding protein
MYQKKKKSLQLFVDEKIKTYKSIFDVSEESILILSNDNIILYANKPMISLLGLKKHFISSVLEMPQIKIKQEWQTLDKLIKKNRIISEKMQIFTHSTLLSERSKEEIPVNLYLSNSYVDVEYKMPCTIITINDLRKEKEKELLGTQHKLTKLPNQTKALSDLNALFAKLHLGEKKIALVIMNIDNFSTLRSIVGYEQSNVILIKFAKYLDKLAKELSFSVYHTLHNNFLLTMPNIDSSTDVIYIVDQIQNELISFYQMENSKLHLTASVGIAMYPDNSTTLNLLDNAYKALTQAEKNGLGRIEMFKSDEIEHNYDDLKLYNDMHQALEKNEFEVYYQPIVETVNKEVVAAEALIRWHHPKHGLIAPYIFIPIMEKTGLIVELGEYVLEEVLKQQKRWELFKFKQIEVSINLSLIELETGKFVEYVSQQLEKHKVFPGLIKFEITEGIAMISEDQTSRQLLALKKLGIGISLDDFGTGYTSFSYLKKIPAGTLKIDRSLVVNIVNNEEDQRIVKAIIELGHNLGMEIVVEGIEDEKMFNMMVDFGSDYIQGYYFSKPLPVFEFQKLLH